MPAPGSEDDREFDVTYVMGRSPAPVAPDNIVSRLDPSRKPQLTGGPDAGCRDGPVRMSVEVGTVKQAVDPRLEPVVQGGRANGKGSGEVRRSAATAPSVVGWRSEGETGEEGDVCV